MWRTIPEMASELGISQQAFRKRYATVMAGWKYQRREGRGGGKEFAVDSLPEELRVVLMPQPEPEVVELVPSPPLQESKSETDEVAVRLEIIGVAIPFLDECKARGGAWDECWVQFRGLYEARDLGLSSAATTLYSKCPSRSSVLRWERELRLKGVGALANQHGKRRGQSKVDEQPDQVRFIQAMIVDFPHCSPEQVWDGLLARFGQPPYAKATLARWMDKFRRANAEVLLAISNPDGWKNQKMVAFGSYSEGIERPNQLWEFDSTPADILLEDGRYNVVGVVDVATRRQRLLVTKTSKAEAILGLFRWCLLNWGVPECIKTDNGKDYTANHVKRVLASFNPAIGHLTCQPFQPWQKPHVERGFRTFSHDLVELLPGYAGHSVAERKELEGRKAFAERLFKRNATVELKLSAAEFQGFCDKWAETQMHEGHEGLQGRTPFEILTSYRGQLKQLAKGSERALDLLLAVAPGKRGERTVGKKGIQLEGQWFIAAELEEFIGQQVLVRCDPLDIGRVYVFGSPLTAERSPLAPLKKGGMEFVCIAECPELTGVSRAEVAQVAKERQKRRVSEAKRALKQVAKQEKVGDIVQEILSKKAEAAQELVAFPQPREVVGLGEFAVAAGAEGWRPAEPAPRNELRRKEVERQVKADQAEEAAAALAYEVGMPTEGEFAALLRKKFTLLSAVDQARYVRFCETHAEALANIDTPRILDLPEALRSRVSRGKQKDLLAWVEEMRPHLREQILDWFPGLGEKPEDVDLTGF